MLSSVTGAILLMGAYGNSPLRTLIVGKHDDRDDPHRPCAGAVDALIATACSRASRSGGRHSVIVASLQCHLPCLAAPQHIDLCANRGKAMFQANWRASRLSAALRSEEHPSALQSQMRSSYA